MTAKELRYGFVFTNYNNSGFTVDLARSLYACRPMRDFRLVVVDNCSEMQNIEALKTLATEHENVDLIRNEKNEGYFRGLNVGLRHLRSHHPEVDYAIVGNNDLLFPEDFFERLEECRPVLNEHPAVSPDIVTLDGIHQNPHVIESVAPVREIIYDLYYSNYFLAVLIKYLARITRRFTDRRDEEQHHVAREIHQGIAACYILGPRFFGNFEELWAPTFLMGEEYFLSKMLKDKGYQVYYEPGIQVRHCYHATTDRLPGRKMWEYSREAHKVYREHVKIFGKKDG